MKDKQNLYWLLPIRCILFIVVFVVGSKIVGKDLEEISNWWSIVASCINVLVILLLMGVSRSKKSNYARLIGYEKGKTKWKEVVVVSVAILLVGMGGMYLAGFLCYGVIPYAAPMMIAPIPAVLAVINVLVLPVTTALAEDGLYLGCGVNQIKNPWAAVLIPAFFFALQHSFIPTLWDSTYIVYRFLSFLPATLLMCGWYQKKKNPVPFMIGHAIIDVATVIQILLTSTIPGFYDSMLAMQVAAK